MSKLSLLDAPRSTIHDSLGWMWYDFPLRIAPMTAIPLAVAECAPLSKRDLGLNLDRARDQLLLAAVMAPATGYISWAFRRHIVRKTVVPHTSDALFQSTYYLLLNTLAEEMFFRGMMIGWLRRWTGPVPAWAISTAVFGLYHIPSGWGSRAVGGVTLAGAIFGGLFTWGPTRGSLLLPSILHAFATCGFLSIGPWLARELEARRISQARHERARIAVENIRASAREAGLDEMTAEDIEAEISSARRERHS